MYKYIAVDCASLLFSNAHKLKQLKAKEVETGATYGFFRSLLFLAEYFHCNKFLFCWDSKYNERKSIFPEYKIKRGKARKKDPELDKIYQSVYKQSDKLKNDILPRCGFNNSFEQNGKEADDVLANLVLYHENILMVSNDEDMYQVLDLCDIWSNSKQKLWSKRSFTKEYGIHPIRWSEVKAIGGCKSDEVPGIPGVGEKTAIKYINGVLGTHTKAYKDIKNGTDIINRNRELVKLPLGKEVIFTIKDDELDYIEFIQVCRDMWFNSFLDQYDTNWENFFRGRV